MAERFTPHFQPLEIQEAFRVFDRDGDGHITMEELQSVLKLFGQVCTNIELRETLKQVDLDGNGTIELGEFMNVMTQVPPCMANTWEEVEREVQKAFCTFDKDQNGLLSCEELLHVMKSLGEMPSKEDIEEMIKHADMDGDGFINYSEFRHIMML